MTDGSLQQIKTTPSLVGEAYNVIHKAILTGNIGTGEQLRQDKLAEGLGVSSRTVREALTQLMADGLVTHVPHKGFSVVSLPFDELAQIYQIRALLEGWAMELAASKITTHELDQMRQLLPQTAANEDPNSVILAREVNRQFHWIAINTTNTKHLINMLTKIWHLVFTHIRQEDEEQNRVTSGKRDIQQHEDLIAALASGDGNKARTITSMHILATLDCFTT